MESGSPVNSHSQAADQSIPEPRSRSSGSAYRHFVVGHFGTAPLLLDPFAGGRTVDADIARDPVRPWRVHEIAMRMPNNLVAAYQRHGDLDNATHGASRRRALPADRSLRTTLQAELPALQARLN